ncbi:MAG: hypothetical protein M0R17_00485 [Candidatus Omnitrophica bacterium]|jgi:hypothetical protein|nr:hypothetical protein [Candidatus Omnitrophota bacterium]
MGVFPKSNSSAALVDYVETRSDSVNKAYTILKNILLGTSKIKTEFYFSDGSEYTLDSSSIFSELGLSTSNDINSVKVWPTFDFDNYYPINYDQNKSEYEQISQKYLTNNKGKYSLIRLNKEKNETYHYITIKNSASTLSNVLFIVLDKTFSDGGQFEFKINFVSDSTVDKSISTNKYPQVVFIDGTYCNICLSYNGNYARIDGIDYEYISRIDLPLSYQTYMNTKFISKTYANEYFLISKNTKTQIFNTFYGKGAKLDITNLNELYFDNYGLFDNEKIKMYKNNDLLLLLKSDDLSYSKVCVDNDEIILKTNNGHSCVLGQNTNKIAYNYSTLFTNTCSNSVIDTNYLINEYPPEFCINKNTPYTSIDCNMKLSVDYTIGNTSSNATVLKFGIQDSDLTAYVKKYNGTYQLYVNEVLLDSKTITDANISKIRISSGYYFVKNKIRLRCAIYSLITNTLLSDYSTEVDISAISNWNPYFETYILANTNTSDYDIVKLQNIALNYNLTKTELDSLFTNELNINSIKYNLYEDYDNDGISLESKIFPVKNIKGYLLTVDSNPKSVFTMANLSSENDKINDISFRCSFIYNKNKSVFYYKPNKGYAEFSSSFSKKSPTDTVTTNDCSDALINETIEYATSGIEENGTSYYQNNTVFSDLLSLILETYQNGISKSITFGSCGKIPYELNVTTNTQITLKISNNKGAASYDDDSNSYDYDYSDNAVVNILNDSNGKSTIIHTYFNYDKTVPNSKVANYFNKSIGDNINYIDEFVNNYNSTNSKDYLYYRPDVGIYLKLKDYDLTNLSIADARNLSIYTMQIDGDISGKVSGLNSINPYINNPKILYLLKKPISSFASIDDIDFSSNSADVVQISSYTMTSEYSNINKTDLVNWGTSGFTNDYVYYDKNYVQLFPTTTTYSDGSSSTDPPNNYKYAYNIITGLMSYFQSFYATSSNVFEGTVGISNLKYVKNGYIIKYKDDSNLLNMSLLRIDNNKYSIGGSRSKSTITGTKTMYKTLSSTEVSSIVKKSEYKMSLKNIGKLDSNYIDTYQDSPINKSNWKLFNYYQLPLNR